MISVRLSSPRVVSCFSKARFPRISILESPLDIGDAGAQTRKTMENIELLLKEAGSDLSHICRIVVYLTDIRYREAVYREMGKWLTGVFPCSTGLVVQAFARPEWVVEIEATAVIPAEVARVKPRTATIPM